MAWDVAGEADAIIATLRALAREPTVVPSMKTSRPFYGVRVGDLRRVAAGWRRGHPQAGPGQVAELADRLWHAGIREEQLVALDPGRRFGLLEAMAGDRAAALPKASSWVLRSWLGPCPAEVAAFVDGHAGRLPALAVRETRAKLATGSKRPPRRAAEAGGRR